MPTLVNVNAAQPAVLTLSIGRSLTVNDLTGGGSYSVLDGNVIIDARTFTAPASIGLGPYTDVVTITLTCSNAGTMTYETGDAELPLSPPAGLNTSGTQNTTTEIIGTDGKAPAVLRGTVSGIRWGGVTQGQVDSFGVDAATRIAIRTQTLASLQEAVQYSADNSKWFELEEGIFEIYGPNGLKIPASYNAFQWKGVRRATRLFQYYLNAPVFQCGALLSGESDSSTVIDGLDCNYGIEQVGQTGAIALKIGNTWKSRFQGVSAQGVTNGSSANTLSPYYACQILKGGSTSGLFFSNTMEDCSFRASQVCNLYVGLNGTGNVFRNIYTSGGAAPNTQPMSGAAVQFTTGGGAYFDNVVEQLNIEWAKTSQTFLAMNNCRDITILGLHIEGCQLTGASPIMVQSNNGSAFITGATFLNCQILTANGISGNPSVFNQFRDGCINLGSVNMQWDDQGADQVDTLYYLTAPDLSAASRSGAIQGGAIKIIDSRSNKNAQVFCKPSTLAKETGWNGMAPYQLEHLKSSEPMMRVRGGIIDIAQTQTVYAAYEEIQWRLTTTPGVASTLTLAIKCYPTAAGSRGQNVPPRVGQMCAVTRGAGTADGFTWTINNSVAVSIGTLTASETILRFYYNGTDWVAA